MRNVLVLQMAERRKQLPCSGAVAARTVYVRHDLLLLLDVTATDSDVLLGIIKVSLLHRAVHAVLLLLSNQVLLLVRPSVRGLLFPKRSCSPPRPDWMTVVAEFDFFAAKRVFEMNLIRGVT